MSSLKAAARRLCSPLLDPLERGDKPYAYKPKNRLILWITSLLFLGLASALVILIPLETNWAVLIPIITFGLVGLGGSIVAWLGSDKAVARIWGTR